MILRIYIFIRNFVIIIEAQTWTELYPRSDICLVYRGTQRQILRKRPKNNNKAWIKLSEAILSILGDCWETFICSPLPARLMEEIAPTSFPTDIAGQLGYSHRGKFPSNTTSKDVLFFPNLPASKN